MRSLSGVAVVAGFIMTCYCFVDARLSRNGICVPYEECFLELSMGGLGRFSVEPYKDQQTHL